jgi:hypothetical protein
MRSSSNPDEMPQREAVLDLLNRIRAEQAARGHIPRSAEEIDADIRQMRGEWEEHDRQIEAIHELSVQGRANGHGASS